MRRETIVMYIGGFSPVGGIESFTHDFLVAIANTYPDRELAVWGQGPRNNPLLNAIIDSGVKIRHTPWRWGCRWNVPDYVLYLLARATMKRASVVIFKRPPPRPILKALRKAALTAEPRPPFVLITPYRPLEYWGSSPEPAELNPFDAIVVQSDEGQDDLQRAGYKGRIAKIPYVTPPTSPPVPFPCTVDTNVIKLGFLGRLEPQKNLLYLLECYRILFDTSDKDLRYELHLFGEGSEKAKLESASNALGLKCVFSHGKVDRAEVSAAIDSCDLFINTSLTEGQCLVALEVLSRGRPFVTTPVGALPEVISNDELGALAPLGDAISFAKQLMRVIALIFKGRLTPESVQANYLSRYDRDKIIKQYTDLISDLVSSLA